METVELPRAIGKNKNGEDIFVTDGMVDNLLDDNTIGASLKEADKKRATLSKEEFHKLRALCKRDLFFLSFSILGNKRLSPNLHGHLCKHVRDTEAYRFHEYLLPRGHFKSTILTIAHSIQIVLPYTNEDRKCDTYIEEFGELSWPYNLGTDARVLIGHETAESAARFLYAITSHFTSNPLLLALFPDAIPSKRKHRINKWELELPRSDVARGNPEPTIDTLGVGAKSQGRHYNYIKLDDIFGDKARDSVTESENTIQWFDNIQSFFSLFREDRLDLIGTRYGSDDVYAHAEEIYGKSMKVYCRKVEEFVKIQDSEGKEVTEKQPIFPEEFDKQSLDILRKNKKVFSAQYENDPYDGEGGLSQYEKKYFYWTGLNTLATFSGDDRFKTTINLRDLDIVFLIDPGIGRTGGFCVTGMDYVGNIYTLLAIPLEIRAPELTDLTFKNAIRWQPRTVAIESDMFAETFQYWWASEMPKRGVRFEVTPVYTLKRAKDLRIAGLTSYAEAGKLYLNEKQEELIKEWNTWGKSKSIHILDALAYGPEIWRPGYAPGQRDVIESTSMDGEKGLEDRDKMTGYSKISYE